MLLAVHVSDGVLTGPTQAGGFALAAGLVAWSARRVSDEEIPRIALLSAAFFVASLIHVPAGVVKVHLLLNGLMGVVLGRRAVLAVAVGLTLQAFLIGHGGTAALGVNVCVMALPALAAGGLFALVSSVVRRSPVLRRLVVVFGFGLWLFAAFVGVELLPRSAGDGLVAPDPLLAAYAALSPVPLAAMLLLAVLAALFESRLETAPDFPLGLLVGEAAVLLTVGLNYVALRYGSLPGVEPVTGLVLVLHLPVAAVEGLILGFTVPYLMRVRPDLLHARRAASGCAEGEQLVERDLPLP